MTERKYHTKLLGTLTKWMTETQLYHHSFPVKNVVEACIHSITKVFMDLSIGFRMCVKPKARDNGFS